jgi:hypothetical protein
VVTPNRAFLIGLVVAVPLGGLFAMACSAGDEISYATQDLTKEAGDGPIVTDSTFEVMTRPDDGGGKPQPIPVPIACSGPFAMDGGCDPSEGRGCCLGGSANTCENQSVFFAAGSSYCRAQNEVFLTCLASDSDNKCCWQPSSATTNSFETRFRVGCSDGGIEACDPTADSGGVCSNGVCTTLTCRGVTLGYCATPGSGAPTCPQ